MLITQLRANSRMARGRAAQLRRIGIVHDNARVQQASSFARRHVIEQLARSTAEKFDHGLPRRNARQACRHFTFRARRLIPAMPTSRKAFCQPRSSASWRSLLSERAARYTRFDEPPPPLVKHLDQHSTVVLVFRPSPAPRSAACRGRSHSSGRRANAFVGHGWIGATGTPPARRPLLHGLPLQEVELQHGRPLFCRVPRASAGTT